MILPCMSSFPWGEPSMFEPLIAGAWGIGGMKCHTIRANQNWKPGSKIHFWSNNPRNKKHKPAHEFNLADPRSAVYWWHHEKGIIHNNLIPRYLHKWPMKHKQAVPLVYAVERVAINIINNHSHYLFTVIIGEGRRQKVFQTKVNPVLKYNYHDFDESFKWLALRDGFVHPFDFIRFFWTYKKPHEDLMFTGQLIHWTDTCLYHPSSADIFQPKIKVHL